MRLISMSYGFPSRGYGRGREEQDKVGFIDASTRAIFGRSYAAEPDVLIEELKEDEAIAEADTLAENPD
ncbi:MAG: hypothetical protein WBE38_03120 [Terracidiphilus sp.]